MDTKQINVLVLCTGNSCRSQMAEGYLRHYAQGRFNVYSAGVETHGLNAKAVACMLQDGIDIAHHTSNLIDDYQDIDFDVVLSVCDHAAERCPVFPSKAKRYHHNFKDPSKCIGPQAEIEQAFIETRNDIKSYCKALTEEILKVE